MFVFFLSCLICHTPQWKGSGADLLFNLTQQRRDKIKFHGSDKVLTSGVQSATVGLFVHFCFQCEWSQLFDVTHAQMLSFIILNWKVQMRCFRMISVIGLVFHFHSKALIVFFHLSIHDFRSLHHRPSHELRTTN